ncbi:MAG: hypothetical protein WDM70_11045, partial [Nitrosomonadales bacterium]
MHIDGIKEVGIDHEGRLYVTPKSKTFPMIYREAMEVHWDVKGRYLYAPPPPRSDLATPIFGIVRLLRLPESNHVIYGLSQNELGELS